MEEQAHRFSRELIDRAIRENRISEYLGYTFSVVFVVCGVAAMAIGIHKGDSVIACAGGIAGVLFWPPFNATMKIRRENIAIRLLEAPLAKASSAEQALDLLNNFFRKELGL